VTRRKSPDSGYIGLPVTIAALAPSRHFVHRHEEIDKDRPGSTGGAGPQAGDGLVIYMGLHNLRRICEELIAGGLRGRRQRGARGSRSVVSATW